MEILNLLPTPIMKLNYIPSDDVLISLQTEKMNKEIHYDNQMSYGVFSIDSYLFKKEIYHSLASVINEYALKYATECLGYDIESLLFTQSWVSHKLPRQVHTQHMHGNSVISGVFYFDKTKELAEPIKFFKQTSSTGVSVMQIPVKREVAIKLYEHSLQPVFGDIILFPSWLYHSVDVNKTDKVRKSLSFNLIPPILGSRLDLTEIQIA
jgi:uncharacterized protein (TIGR02466 family)